MTEVTSYHNPNAPIERRWIAYVVMDNGKLWGVYSASDTEEGAKGNIWNLWLTERAKAARINSEAQPFVKSAPGSPPTSDPWAAHGINSTAWGDLALDVKSDGRGHHSKGMVWLINTISRAKCRVSPEAAEEMISAGGWERGGPRSK